MTKSIAKEVARKNIRVNAICPGFIETPMAMAVPERVLDGFRKEIPLGRLGQPQEVANLVSGVRQLDSMA